MPMEPSWKAGGGLPYKCWGEQGRIKSGLIWLVWDKIHDHEEI